MSEYQNYRNRLNSSPDLRYEVFLHHYNLGRFGNIPESDAFIRFEGVFSNDPRSIEPLITDYFVRNPQVSQNPNNLGNNSNNRNRDSNNLEKKIAKSIAVLGSGLIAAGFSQLTDIEATKTILEIYAAGAVSAGGIGAAYYGFKNKF